MLPCAGPIIIAMHQRLWMFPTEKVPVFASQWLVGFHLLSHRIVEASNSHFMWFTNDFFTLVRWLHFCSSIGKDSSRTYANYAPKISANRNRALIVSIFFGHANKSHKNHICETCRSPLCKNREKWEKSAANNLAFYQFCKGGKCYQIFFQKSIFIQKMKAFTKVCVNDSTNWWKPHACINSAHSCSCIANYLLYNFASNALCFLHYAT